MRLRKGRSVELSWGAAWSCARAQQLRKGRSVGVRTAQRGAAQGARHGAAQGCGMRLRWLWVGRGGGGISAGRGGGVVLWWSCARGLHGV